jgi:hypothetical protein
MAIRNMNKIGFTLTLPSPIEGEGNLEGRYFKGMQP